MVWLRKKVDPLAHLKLTAPPQPTPVPFVLDDRLVEGEAVSVRKLKGAVRLFRYWRIKYDENYVHSTIASHRWEPGWNTAHQQIDHLTPGFSAHHGFYGFSSYSLLIKQEGQVLETKWPSTQEEATGRDPFGFSPTPPSVGCIAGTILCYGRIAIHKYGARAEKTKIESFIESRNVDNAIRTLSIADVYSVPVISEETAHNLAGGLVPYQKDKL